jgi:hypothetical protein
MAAVATGTEGKFAILTMNKSDRIRFLHFPEDVYRKVEDVLRQSWPPGIKSEGRYAGSYEYTMKGRPWGMIGKVEAIGSRVLLRNILQYLYDNSWVLTTALSVTEKVGSKDSLLFKKALTTPPAAAWFVVQFYHRNKIYLHGAPAAMISEFREVLTKLEYFDKGDWNHDAYELCLKGSPWTAQKELAMKVRVLILQIAELMEKYGWETYGTLKQRTESDDSRICDSWYFIRPFDVASKALINDSGKSTGGVLD